MRIHFAGAGQSAEYVARRLIREGHDLCMVDRDESRCRDLSETLDAQVMLGDATRIENWRRAGLHETDLFVACTDSDQTNVLTCLIANELAPAALKAIRLRTPEYADWGSMLKDLGVRVDRVVHPEIDIVERILRVIAIPGVSDIRNFADERVKVFSMNVEPNSVLAGQAVGGMGAGGLLDAARVCLIFRGAGVIVPRDGAKLEPGDHIYLVTTREALEKTLIAVGAARSERLNEVFIIGGGEIGLELARALEVRDIPAKLFEHDPERCQFLADALNETTVINADGTDQRILRRENLEGVSALVPLTHNDDANLIVAMLARRLGVKKVIPLLQRLEYLPLAQQLGINTSVSPRVKTADALFEFIRGAGVLSVRTLGEEAAEAIELEVPVQSRFTGLALSDVELPPETLIGAVARPGEAAFLPGPDTLIHAGDRVVFFAREDAIQELEAKVINGR